jgi:membrane associated rhomboid family serine protease
VGDVDLTLPGACDRSRGRCRPLLSRPVIPIRDNNPTTRRAYVTLGIIAANVLVFFLWQPRSFASGSGSMSTNQIQIEQTKFLYENAMVPCEVKEGEPITVAEYEREDCGIRPSRQNPEIFPDKHARLAVLTSMFLHAGLLHIGGNMLFLWIFGNNVEDRVGPILFVIFYGVGGVVAAVGHYLSDPTSITPVIGASGAVAAVMGAYFVWWPRALVTTLVFFFIPVRIPAFVFLGIWFVLQFLSNPDSGVATIAHIAGFVFGALIALIFKGQFEERSRVRIAGLDDPWGPYRYR